MSVRTVSLVATAEILIVHEDVLIKPTIDHRLDSGQDQLAAVTRVDKRMANEEPCKC